MKSKYVPLNDDLYDYLCQKRSKANDPILDELRAETEKLGDHAQMQISREQGAFMTLLVAGIRAERVLEIGTFTGYSSICLARGLGKGGRLLCIDASEEWTSVARRYWKRAGLQDRIELRLGSAIPLLKSLDPSASFDFVFIDAQKTEYDSYYELALPRTKQNGLILFDNMLSGGRVIEQPIEEESTRTLDKLNAKLAADPRVECVLIPIADGLQICRKL